MNAKFLSMACFQGVTMVLGAVTLLLAAETAQAQFPPSLVNQIKNETASRVAALDVLSGDYGLSGGSYHTDNGGDINVSKFGGMGDVGLSELGGPAPLGNTGIGWQPRLQGNMGTLTAKRTYDSSTPLVNGDQNEYNTYAIQFGGGARFWFGDSLSFTPTIMGMYGHTYDNYNPTAAHQSLFENAKAAGLVDWDIDTWTLRPAGELSYIYTWKRTIFTLTSAGTYYHTESFNSSSPNFTINSDAESWQNKLDVDVPLGVQLYNHELRTGGYFSRTEFYNDLQTGLNTGHMYEAHGRVVLDFLNQLWKVQWIGIGASYLWGSNFHGVTYGADVAFRF